MTNAFRRVFCTLAYAGLSGLVASAHAGDLNPPAGPVAPTMKTLSDVEPRIALNAANTPGDADSVFKITQPGSYYLTGNITGVAGKHGIEIAVGPSGPAVTLDLMGFEVAGMPGSQTGVVVTGSGLHNLTIRNGTVRNWPSGGVETGAFTAQNVRVEQILAYANGSRGIFVFRSSSIVDCQAVSNTGLGIQAGEGCSVSRCIVRANAGGGIVVGSGSAVSDCTVTSNPGGGIFTIAGARGCLITNCVADENGGDGINAANASVVSGCTATGNSEDGIDVSNGCTVTACTAQNNPNGSGIRVMNASCRIENNNVLLNNRGIEVLGLGNVIIRNSARSNTTNFDIPAGNLTGTIVASEAALNAAANANVNIEY